MLFYSRRIGLANGREVPILGGGRLSGRAGRYSVGVINVQARDDEVALAQSTNFTVARVKRDLLRKSSIGAPVTHRSLSQGGRGMNDAYGLDSTFAFFDNLAINAYWARTHSDRLTGDDASYRAQLDYSGDRYGVRLGVVAVYSGRDDEALAHLRQSLDIREKALAPDDVDVGWSLYWLGATIVPNYSRAAPMSVDVPLTRCSVNTPVVSTAKTTRPT